MRRQSRPLIANHVHVIQPRPARNQNVPGSPPSFSRIEIFAQGESLVRGTSLTYDFLGWIFTKFPACLSMVDIYYKADIY